MITCRTCGAFISHDNWSALTIPPLCNTCSGGGVGVALAQEVYGGTAPETWTARQRYKAAALTGLLARPERVRTPGEKTVALWTGEYADAQLAEDAQHAQYAKGVTNA
jgi:hypothetical protein